MTTKDQNPYTTSEDLTPESSVLTSVIRSVPLYEAMGSDAARKGRGIQSGPGSPGFWRSTETATIAPHAWRQLKSFPFKWFSRLA